MVERNLMLSLPFEVVGRLVAAFGTDDVSESDPVVIEGIITGEIEVVADWALEELHRTFKGFLRKQPLLEHGLYSFLRQG